MASNPQPLTAVVANPAGEIFDLRGYAAVGMSGKLLYPLGASVTRPLPHGSELMFLPDRYPVAMNLATGRLETLKTNPHQPDEPLHPVAAFNSPGYVITAACAFQPPAHRQIVAPFFIRRPGMAPGKISLRRSAGRYRAAAGSQTHAPPKGRRRDQRDAQTIAAQPSQSASGKLCA